MNYSYYSTSNCKTSVTEKPEIKLRMQLQPFCAAALFSHQVTTNQNPARFAPLLVHRLNRSHKPHKNDKNTDKEQLIDLKYLTWDKTDDKMIKENTMFL